MFAVDTQMALSWVLSDDIKTKFILSKMDWKMLKIESKDGKILVWFLCLMAYQPLLVI